MQWFNLSFEKLTTKDLYEILRARNEVFIVEQSCAYQDLDEKDFTAQHLFAKNEKGTIIAYCRILPRNISYPECSIGRVITNIHYRKTGLGRLLMEEAIRFINTAWQETEIRISAQQYLKAFYESLGFQQCSEPYLEDDIPHIEMYRL